MNKANQVLTLCEAMDKEKWAHYNIIEKQFKYEISLGSKKQVIMVDARDESEAEDKALAFADDKWGLKSDQEREKVSIKKLS